VIVLGRAHLRQIADQAEAAYPDECCGLLTGRGDPAGTLRVGEVCPSPNLAPSGRDRFEVDPALRLDLQRRLRGGPDRVIGLYHSHPDHSAQPSQTDLDMAWETDLAWLIVCVEAGQAVHVTAHRLVDEGAGFAEIGLRTDDWRAAPRRAPMAGAGVAAPPSAARR
jgi:proteasome lid subunit RPN8/RPN11